MLSTWSLLLFISTHVISLSENEIFQDSQCVRTAWEAIKNSQVPFQIHWLRTWNRPRYRGVGTSAHVCTHMWRPCLFYQSLSTLSFGSGSLTKPGAHLQLECLASEAQGSYLRTPPNPLLGLQASPLQSTFHVGSEGSNSSLYSCAANMFLTESPP